MQAEATEDLKVIVERKEYERQAGGGMFCWCFESAPASMVRDLARRRHVVPVVFTLMKGKPRKNDAAIWIVTAKNLSG